MAKQDPYKGAPRHLFVVPCVELEDSKFRSVRDALDGCTQSGCGDNAKHCGEPDLLRYALAGFVKRTGEVR